MFSCSSVETNIVFSCSGILPYHPSLEPATSLSRTRSVIFQNKQTKNSGYFPINQHTHATVKTISFSQFLRLGCICSQDEDFRVCCSKVLQHLMQRAYPTYIITSALQLVNKYRTQTLQYKPKDSTHRVPFIVTRKSRRPPFRQWLKELLLYPYSSIRPQQTVPEPLILGERNNRSLRTTLTHSFLHLRLFLNREGRGGTKDNFTTSFLHFSLFSTAL